MAEKTAENVKELTVSGLYTFMLPTDVDAAEILKEAEVDGRCLVTFDREDMKDLFPQNNQFHIRQKLWKLIQQNKLAGETSTETVTPRLENVDNGATRKTQTPVKNTMPASANIKLLKFPLYCDNFVTKCAIEGKFDNKAKDHLIKNTINSMRAICYREEEREPTMVEVDEVSKYLIHKYPALRDDSVINPRKPYAGFIKKMKKALSNRKSVVTPQGKCPQRSIKRRLGLTPDTVTACERLSLIEPSEITCIVEDPFTTESDNWSETGSVMMSPEPVSIETELSSYHDEYSTTDDTCEMELAHHYSKLKDLMQAKKPNQKVIAHLLDLEIKGRRNFIESLSGSKDKDKVSKILEAYPCFKCIDECIEEIRRLVAPNTEQYNTQVINKMENLWDKMLFWGLSRNVMKPPKNLTKVAKFGAILQNMMDLFPGKKKTTTFLKEVKRIHTWPSNSPAIQCH